MLFIAIPVLVDAMLAAAATTIAVKVTSDIYDKLTSDEDQHNSKSTDQSDD